MEHKVKVNLVTRQKKKEELLSNRTLKLPRRVIAALFGDATQILILKPGQTVKTVEFYEIPDVENKWAEVNGYGC